MTMAMSVIVGTLVDKWQATSECGMQCWTLFTRDMIGNIALK